MPDMVDEATFCGSFVESAPKDNQNGKYSKIQKSSMTFLKHKNLEIFSEERNASAVYWSSVQYRANTNNAWNANMNNGQVNNNNKNNNNRVVCVSEKGVQKITPQKKGGFFVQKKLTFFRKKETIKVNIKTLIPMKKIFSFSILILLIFGLFGEASAVWFPGNGVLWIKHMDTPGVDSADRYTAGTYNGRSAYLDTLTGLKWATNDQNTSIQWATSTSYGEPVWNGTSYDYPSGRTEVDYPAFRHCTDLGAGWRLPTRKEIQSIISRTKSSAPYSYLPNIASAVYWSSVQYRANTDYAWRAGMNYGQVRGSNKGNNSRVVCVSE